MQMQQTTANENWFNLTSLVVFWCNPHLPKTSNNMIFIIFFVGIDFANNETSVYLQISLPPLPALLMKIMRVFFGA